MAYEMRGFTLIEVIIVIVIIGIVVLFALVDVSWLQRDVQLTQMRDQLLADLEYAKRMSIAQAPHGIFFYNNKYEVRVCNDANNNFVKDAAETSDYYKKNADGTPTPESLINLDNYNIALTWDTCGGDLQLWFDRKGIPRCNDWSVGSGTLTLTKSGQDRTLSINTTGMITYE